ncbi:hypothetical protein M422DRAFT_246371 [Sphaerobolus stellatus SS14]|nr:hypothetical protein M422DRAFT_246371 [Sphaerobolus stellatus SS14]
MADWSSPEICAGLWPARRPEKFLPENFRRTGQAWEGENSGDDQFVRFDPSVTASLVTQCFPANTGDASQAEGLVSGWQHRRLAILVVESPFALIDPVVALERRLVTSESASTNRPIRRGTGIGLAASMAGDLGDPRRTRRMVHISVALY